MDQFCFFTSGSQVCEGLVTRSVDDQQTRNFKVKVVEFVDVFGLHGDGFNRKEGSSDLLSDSCILSTQRRSEVNAAEEPPASPSWTFECLILSNREVLPVST